MAPASWAEPEDITVKQEGYKNMMTSNHYPANGAHLFPNIALDPDKDIKTLPHIATTDEAKRMAGMLPYKPAPDDLPDWKPVYDKRYDWLNTRSGSFLRYYDGDI